MTTPIETDGFDPQAIERPDPLLFRYYVFVSLLSGPLTPLVLLPLYFRYITLRYKFDEAGVSMRWGILFRKEVYLTYRRIQDIHLTRNLLQRWMGLAKISLQTASGSSQAEMGIEGVLQPERLRDYLYSQMRGAKGDPDVRQASDGSESSSGVQPAVGAATNDQRAIAALLDIKQALQQLVDKQQGSAAGDAP
ncbi:MAG: PH domain-containing protein [Pirellulaceae bacterium]